MRKFSLAHAPRSMFLQRSLQNGRNVLDGAYTLSPPQVGHATSFSVLMNTMPLQKRCRQRLSEVCRLPQAA